MKITRLPSGDIASVQGEGLSVSLSLDPDGLVIHLVNPEGREITGRYDPDFGLSLGWSTPARPAREERPARPANVLEFKREEEG